MPQHYAVNGGRVLRPCRTLCILLGEDDQHHGAAQLLLHVGNLPEQLFRRLGLHHTQQTEPRRSRVSR